MPDELGPHADRGAIDDLLVRYATAVDARDWSLLDTVFSHDACLDYRSAGGIRGTYTEVRGWLAEVLPMFTWTQHLVVNRPLPRPPGPNTRRMAHHRSRRGDHLVGEPDARPAAGSLPAAA